MSDVMERLLGTQPKSAIVDPIQLSINSTSLTYVHSCSRFDNSKVVVHAECVQDVILCSC